MESQQQMPHQHTNSPYLHPPPEPKPEIPEKKRKRPADMPRRPLSAYNFFFSEERVRVLASIPDPNVKDEESKVADKTDANVNANANVDASEEVSPVTKEATSENSTDTSNRLLLIRDAKSIKRRPHRKSHGKIAFKDLAKEIGKRWRALKDDGKTRYTELAEKDLRRYSEQMKEYNTKKNSRFTGVSYQTAPGPLPPQFNAPVMNANANTIGGSHGGVVQIPATQPQAQPAHNSFMANHHTHGPSMDNNNGHPGHPQDHVPHHSISPQNNLETMIDINGNGLAAEYTVDTLVDHRQHHHHHQQQQQEHSLSVNNDQHINVNVGGAMPSMEGDLQHGGDSHTSNI
jgi:hypothetical protein